MSLMRWKPFSEIDNLQREMNSLFDSLVPASMDRLSSGFVPAAEMEETADDIRLKLEIPGMDAKDIDIQVSAESIAITGERKSESKTEEKGVQNTNISAEYKDGILNITLPKAEAEKDKVVKVKIS